MVQFEVDPVNRLVRACASGNISYADIVQFLKEMFDCEGYDPRFNALITVEEITSSLEDEKELFGVLVTEFAKKCGDARWAFVAGDGLSREILEMTFGGIDRANVHLRVFDRRREASDWLKGQG